VPPHRYPFRGHRFWIAPAYFLIAAGPGCWVPVLANVLKAHDWGHLITVSFLIPPLAGTLAPLAFAAAADQRFSAEKVLTFCLWSGAAFLYMAFHMIETGGPPAIYLGCFAIFAATGAPAWSILTAIALTNLREGERSFGLYRVWGTIGWMAAGWTVSLLAVDESATTGKLAVLTRILAGFVCLMLPPTPPQEVGPRTWKDALGLSSLRVLRQRDIAVVLSTSFLFSIPLVAFYMQTPQLLAVLGHERVAAAMTLGQATEIAAMLMLGLLLTRWRIKWLLLLALAAGTLRYAWYALGAAQQSLGWVLAGIALHGVCWTFFFEAGRVFLNRRVEAGFRAQVQALMTLVSGGAASILGALLIGNLQRLWVPEDSLPGWQLFWTVLALFCGCCTLYFAIGYRGERRAA